MLVYARFVQVVVKHDRSFLILIYCHICAKLTYCSVGTVEKTQHQQNEPSSLVHSEHQLSCRLSATRDVVVRVVQNISFIFHDSALYRGTTKAKQSIVRSMKTDRRTKKTLKCRAEACYRVFVFSKHSWGLFGVRLQDRRLEELVR